MLYLTNSKNELAKKDLRLAYSQGNNTTYPPNIKTMARYLSTQYPNNKPAHQRGSKKGDTRKGDDLKSEDKASNTGGTACAHVEDTTTPEESTAPSGGASISAHVSEINQGSSYPIRMVAHPMDGDDFWGITNPGDVSLDTANSEEMMAGSHITKQLTCKYQGPDQLELLEMASKEPKLHDLSHNYQLDSSKKSKYSDILLNVLLTKKNTNNVTNTVDSDVLNQENQDYHNQSDQQYIARKYDNGLEQVTLELVPDIILEEEEDGSHKCADNYDQWDST